MKQLRIECAEDGEEGEGISLSTFTSHDQLVSRQRAFYFVDKFH